MNKLLIHSNNTSFNRPELFSISEQFVFDVDFDKDVDLYIHEKLSSESNDDLKKKIERSDILFIKVSLSQNYLEYLGLRLAYHIRLTKSLREKALLPIVFVAEESLQFLGLTYTEPSIMFTKGIFIIKESLVDYQKTIKWINEGRLKSLDDFPSFVSSITINPPANYLSHHSIANEWSILRWAKVLGISTERETLKDVQSNIESLLYYKYLYAKYPIEAEPDKAAFKINGKGRILYIDDEWNKGWNEVLSNYFTTSSTEIEFETLKYNFKDKSHLDILEECDKKIKNFKPDIVLLDLRLSDSDFINSPNSTHLTGYKVLEAIKSINPGIQVIIFTASNKVWNFTELHKAGCDDFILKESPELSTDNEYSRNAIAKMATSVSNAFKMSFLKKVYLKMAEVEKQIPVTVANNEEEADFTLRLKNNLSIAFKLLNETKVSAKYYNYAYLQLFQIIEDFSNLSYVFSNSLDCFVYVNDKAVCVNKTLIDKWETAISFTSKYIIGHKTLPITEKMKRFDTNYIVSAILIFRLGYDNSSALSWTNIYTMRNTKAAHFNIDDAINEDAIFTLLDFIKNFISPQKQKETNIRKGLKVKSHQENIELLKSHFNQ
jgi:CheY-like chemotaxis protein